MSEEQHLLVNNCLGFIGFDYAVDVNGIYLRDHFKRSIGVASLFKVGMRIMPIFHQVISYFSVYKKYIGNRLYIVFFLSFLAAVTEGFGIAMLLPLIDVAGTGIGAADMGESGVKAGLQILLNTLGIGSSLVGILLFIALVFVIKGLIIFCANAYQGHLMSQLLREMRVLMFDKYSTMDYEFYSKRNTGHFINVINLQINRFITSFDNYKKFLAIIITTIAYLCTSFLLAWKFAFMALISGIILLFLFRGLNTYVHGLSQKTASEQGIMNKYLVQTIQSFKYLASTSQIYQLRSGVVHSNEKIASYMRSYSFAQSLTMALSEPIAIFFILLVIIIQVAFLNEPLVPIFVALVLFNRAMGSLLGIQQAWQATLNKIGALEIVEKEFADLSENQASCGIRKMEPLKQGIELRNVSFAYDASHGDVLENINLDIPVNSTLAFVGESGAGKSTIADLLTLMLRPNQGEVFLDGIPGHEVDLHSWRCQIGYVSQETVIFDDTIANNICLWRENYDNDPEARQRIEAAALQAHAETFICDLPQRYNTLIGDRGIRLSGGQRQRLFLARELYKNPGLLILDEATSTLDSESEKCIQESIEALKGRTTVAIIAHRLSTIRHADQIYVLDRGRIIEQGTYDELTSRGGGRFKRMVELQKL